MTSPFVSSIAGITISAITVLLNCGLMADTVHLNLDASQSSVTITVAGESDVSAISGTSRIDLQPVSEPFGTAQVTALTATLDDGFEIGFLGGLVSVSAAPGDIMTNQVSAGPAGNVDGNNQFSQPGNTTLSSGDVVVFDPFGFVGGSQTLDLASIGPAPFDIETAQLSLNGNVLTLTADFTITQEISDGISFTLDVVVVATGSVPETIPATLLTVFRGIQVGGDLEDASDSDDAWLQFHPGITLSAAEPPVWLVFESTLPGDAPQQLALKLEAGANTVGLSQTIEFFNFDSGNFELMDTRAANQTDSVVEVIAEGNIDRFVQSETGAVRVRTGWKAVGPVLVFPWQINVDQLVWLVVP